MNDLPIVLNEVWKDFPLKRERPGFKEFVLNMPKFLRNNSTQFSALRGITLTVKPGECLGIVGRNGAGKSTLLSVMLGTIFPTRGSVVVRGKRTPLLQLGSGFHFDLTGTENALMNGVLLGMTKAEVLDRMEAITEYAGLGEFMAHPLRTYSSGMIMRLAFSVAVHTDPEILLIDEILSVGDESFQRKSSETLRSLIKSGVTTVYVSHSLQYVKTLCDRVLWIDKGQVADEGDPVQVVDNYLSHVS